MKFKSISRLILLTSIVAALLLAGCQKTETTTASAGGGTVSASGLPIVSTPITVRALSETRTDRTMSNSIRAIQELEKRTNIHIEWEVLPATNPDRDTKFHAVIASGDIPDIIDGLNSPVLINRYGMQGILADLTPLIEQYGPNITRVFNNPIEGDEIPYELNVWGDITAKDGKIYSIPIVSASNAIGAIWAIRGDWLTKLGLAVPTTSDELYTVLKAFKEKNPSGRAERDEIPLVSAQGPRSHVNILPLINAFDAHMDLYVDPVDQKIKYGPIEPQFRAGLQYLAKLYAEGLLESDYLTSTNDQWLARAGGNRVGMQFVWPGSGLGVSNTELQKLNPEFHFVPMAPLKSPSGRQYKDTRSAGAALAYRTSINAKSRYTAEIMRLIDYCFSPEGEILGSWGIEGETFTMVNGQPQFNDFIMKNPEGKNPETAQIHFGIRWNLLPYQNAWAPNFQSMAPDSPWTVEAWRIYQKPGMVEGPLPVLGLTEDELSRRATLAAEIDTYKNPMIDRFIMGQEPLSSFDEFVANIRRAGLDELLTMMNAAYDVYKANLQ